jgi:hypothetical protein
MTNTDDTCPKCHHQHDPTKCQGHVVKDPETREPIAPRQCAKDPLKGQRVCRSHGGSTLLAKEAGARRLQEAAADEAIRKLWPGLADATPVKDPVASLARLAGALEHMADDVGARVNTLTNLSGGQHLTQLRGEVVLLERVLAQLRLVTGDMARLNLGARQVELAQGQAQLVISAAQAGLEALAAVLDLPAEAREVFLRALVARLRAGRADVVVAGEVAS